VPDRVVAAAGVVHLDGLELQPFGEAVDGIDDAAASRRQRADVEMVRGRDGEPDQRAVVKHRHGESHVGPVRGAAVRIVVHDHVARPDCIAAGSQLLQDAADITGDRAGLQRRAHLAFAELAPLGIGECRAEILGFADDAGIAHPHQLVAHLDRDVFQRAVDYGGCDRIDPRGGHLIGGHSKGGAVHAVSPARSTRLPDGSTLAPHPGGTTVVLSDCRTIAGPANRAPIGSRVRR
jgi:hypothetical protein